MKCLVATLLVLLFALPSFAQPGVDNCCGVDRECTSVDQWVEGYFDFQSNQCASDAPAMSMAGTGQNYYAFSGGVTHHDWQEVGTITLTRGKWEVRARSQQTVWYQLSTTDDQNCLKMAWWGAYGFGYYRLVREWGPWHYPDVVLVQYPCEVKVEIWYTGNPPWKLFLNKIDTNI